MKTIWFIIVVAFALRVHAQDAHQWRAAFTVTDDFGKPVNGANVTVFYDVPPRAVSTNSGKITGVTDKNGAFVASHEDRTFRLRFLVEKVGYYPTDIKDDFHGGFTPEHLNRDLTIVLKKVSNPIPMYAKWINENPPVLDQAIGYDLIAGDWISPYGKGHVADIIFTKTSSRIAGGDYDYTAKITFSNKGDGIQVYAMPKEEIGSALRSPHKAPIDGYQPELTRRTSAHPGQSPKFEFDENRTYLFRVRTALDQNGTVKSALYGKIYGDFMQFTYYLNPTPNDNDIEFDPKQNLLNEQIAAP